MTKQPASNSIAKRQQMGTYRDGGAAIIQRFVQGLTRRWRHAGYGNRFYNARLKGLHSNQLLASPDDPAPGNRQQGQLMLEGFMGYGSERLPLTVDFWLDLGSVSTGFQRFAHRFHWLEDLAQMGDLPRARTVAESLIASWLDLYGDCWHANVWEAETLSRRIMAWAVHAPLILSSKNSVFRSRILYAMAKQSRHLMRVHSDAPIGLGQIQTAVALLMSGMVLRHGKNRQEKGERLLQQRLIEVVRADGGPISRSASDAIRIMQLLILVKSTYIDLDADLPPWVQTTLDKLAPFVRAQRHSNGAFAALQGATPEGGHGTDAILASSEATGRAIESAYQSGMQRIEQGHTVVIIDAGAPPSRMASNRGTASTGAFELSCGEDLLIVNMGPARTKGKPDSFLAELSKLSRTTAAHSTLALCDTNSVAITENGRLGKGITRVMQSRENVDTGILVSLSHDGYVKRFGIETKRDLKLSSGGERLIGLDRLKAVKKVRKKSLSAAIRFHLHPNVTATQLEDGRIELTAPNSRWIFSAEAGAIKLEDSLYLPTPDTPKATKQIVVSTRLSKSELAAGASHQVKWQLRRT